MDKLFSKFSAELKPNSFVLDLGSHDGRFAKELSGLGHRAVCVDLRERPSELAEEIEWQSVDIKTWVQNNPVSEYDGVFARNVIQFFDKNFVSGTLVPFLGSKLNAGGLIAIETFYKPADPPFPKPFLSYWELEELKKLFPEYDIVYSDSFDEAAHDMAGNTRHFYITDLITKKK